ncbi:hypothetical protein BABA_15387 [Neobacillus bataviensis LMG 21833]|uniref:Uncharacterized protein n=1 Tax=Neobacillus bataviensis LMG 21833 TaxID=1117379 RepID=K6C5Y3_9BACI|nr:hypothetical protein [Neobacillus bataviensis]EKN66505.1 hypothetical protein BABA_15387 [Neobacillus bataviensis LMG 21833]
MNNTNSIILIGEKVDNQELQITCKTNSFEEGQLIPKPTENSPYRSIPLEDDTNISFYFRGCSVRFNLEERSLSVVEVDRELTEDDAFDVLADFAIKEGNRISLLRIPPLRKTRTGKRQKVQIVAEEKKLGEE